MTIKNRSDYDKEIVFPLISETRDFIDEIKKHIQF